MYNLTIVVIFSGRFTGGRGEVLNIICEERLPGHGFQVIEQVLGHLFHSPKLIFYCFQRHNFWEGLAVWGVAHPLPKIYK